MENKLSIQETINWTPEIIVNLISEIAWPIVVLLVAWNFKDSIVSGLKNFLDSNNPTEVSVGASGLTAKFEASKQTDLVKTPKTIDPLPEGQDAESIKKIHIERSTQYSLEILEKVREHVARLDLNDEDKIELLSTEVSLLQANLNYIDITTVLFISQYNLFNKYFYPQNILTNEEIEHQFKEVKTLHEVGYQDWDMTKYIAYPLSANLIEECDNGYKLTNFGMSYVMHVRNNPIFLDYMANM